MSLDAQAFEQLKCFLNVRPNYYVDKAILDHWDSRMVRIAEFFRGAL